MPAREADYRAEPELCRPVMQRPAQDAGAEHVGCGRVGHVGERVDEHVGRLVGHEASGEGDARFLQARHRAVVEALDGRLAGLEALGWDADVLRPRHRRRAVRKHPRQPRGVGLRGVVVVLIRPRDAVVLAGDERHLLRGGQRGRPPRAEQVRVDEVGVRQARREPLGKGPSDGCHCSPAPWVKASTANPCSRAMARPAALAPPARKRVRTL